MENLNDNIYKNRMIILINVVLLTFMCTLDSSIVNVALPEMSKNLSATTESIAWIITAYLIAIVGTILIFGRLGDLKGKTLVFKYGILLFTFGSLMCAVSSSLVFLIISRMIQGIGASASMANSQGIITQVFPANERGKALGITGTFVALGTMVGPPLGGFIIDAMSWKYIFLINIPVGIFVYIFGMKFLPKSDIVLQEKLDSKGALLFAVTAVSLFGSLTIGRNMGYENPVIIAGFVTAIISLIIFIFIEKKVKEPLLQLKIFENKLFSLSIFCAFTSFIAISSSTIIQPFNCRMYCGLVRRIPV